MKIPLTKLGYPQVIIYPAIVLAAMALTLVAGVFLLGLWATVIIQLLLATVLIWALSFFRDPHRDICPDRDILLSPADGKVTDVDIVDEPEFIGSKALRIGIFLSVFNVHINRSPCQVRVHSTHYKKGQYKNALSPESARVNESNSVYMTRLGRPADKLIVRQISGAIARHIVCCAEPGTTLRQGQRFGMIKFGSRTELYLPASDIAQCKVKPGQKVTAGETVMVKYVPSGTEADQTQRDTMVQGI